MKYLVLLTALIALLSCGSGSNPIAPNPSMDTSQSGEKNESPVAENPLVEPPEVMVEPPLVGVIEPPEVAVDPEIGAVIEAIIRDLPKPPEPPEDAAEPPLVGVIIEPAELPEVIDDPEIEVIIEAILRDLPKPPEDPPPDE